MPVVIRSFRANEYDTWKALWDAYYEDGKEPWLPSRITRKVWRDLHDRAKPLKAYGVWYKGEAAGIAVYASLYTPHAAKPVLYLSDLYVLPEFRRRKLGSKLLKVLFEKQGPKHCHIEWKTREKNAVAHRLYKQYAKKTNWIIYERQVEH